MLNWLCVNPPHPLEVVDKHTSTHIENVYMDISALKCYMLVRKTKGEAEKLSCNEGD